MTQAMSRPPAVPVCRAMSAETMKMPEPIIEPTTIIVASSRPSPFTSPLSAGLRWAAIVRGVSDISAPPLTCPIRKLDGCFQKLTRSQGRFGGAEQIARHRHRVGAGAKHVAGALQRDPADRDQRLPGQRSRPLEELQSHHRVRVLLGMG